MGLKTAGVGHFTIPTAPAAGTSCTSGAANVFTTTYVQLIASTSAALYITGIHLESAAALAATYIVVQLASGGAGSETIIGQYLVPLSTGSTVALGYRQIYPPIPVANAARISCKTADSVGAKATLVTLECINQSNVVDDGVAVGTVTTLTNLPAITANWITAAGINAGALNGKGDWSTYAGGDTAGTTTLLARLTAGRATNLDNLDAAVSSRSTYAGADTGGTTTLLARLTATRAGLMDNMDAAVSTRLATAGYTAPDNAGVAAIKAKTDSLVFTVAGKVDAGLYYVNGISITGSGTDAAPWKAP